jgi:hypothetical protein
MAKFPHSAPFSLSGGPEQLDPAAGGCRVFLIRNFFMRNFFMRNFAPWAALGYCNPLEAPA